MYIYQGVKEVKVDKPERYRI